MDNLVEKSGKSGQDGASRRGPDPERLKLPHKDWEEAVREALEDEKASQGRPEDDRTDEKPDDAS